MDSVVEAGSLSALSLALFARLFVVVAAGVSRR
jgi:hypothetical protein